MHIIHMLDLSTAHLPEQILNNLNGYDGVIATEREYGALLHVPSDPAETEQDYGTIPTEVLAVQLYARRHGCDYVLFDADAEIDDNLPSWDWQTGKRVPARLSAAAFSPRELDVLVRTAAEMRVGVAESDLSTLQIDVLGTAAQMWAHEHDAEGDDDGQ
jgi:hypothetical protein